MLWRPLLIVSVFYWPATVSFLAALKANYVSRKAGAENHAYFQAVINVTLISS